MRWLDHERRNENVKLWPMLRVRPEQIETAKEIRAKLPKPGRVAEAEGHKHRWHGELAALAAEEWLLYLGLSASEAVWRRRTVRYGPDFRVGGRGLRLRTTTPDKHPVKPTDEFGISDAQRAHPPTDGVLFAEVVIASYAAPEPQKYDDVKWVRFFGSITLGEAWQIGKPGSQPRKGVSLTDIYVAHLLPPTEWLCEANRTLDFCAREAGTLLPRGWAGRA